MAVPKKKTSKAKSRSRRASNWVLRRPAAACALSATTPRSPTCVPDCGWYKGRQAIEID